ncbi:MAG: hypothetical protein HC804_11350 [Anaerolineae bacterium]|nr:hypothetical protein [Anaerolineae bacterium]
MQSVTVEIPDEMAQQLQPFEAELPRILALGLREFTASRQPGFEGSAELLSFLTTLPSPEEVIALRPSPEMQHRIHLLLEKNKNEGLSAAEEQEWEQYQYLEHLVRMAKAKAHLKLQQP